MPITLAPASPLGSEASIGIGAGAAAQNAKMFPTLASLYAHIASLRGGGGGGGGHGGYIGGVQVLPKDDGGATYQVEAQANRDQQAQSLTQQLGQPDYVLGHIRERENFQLQQQKQAQDALAQRRAGLNQQQNNGPPINPWTRDDEVRMAKATQALASVQDQYEGAQIDEHTYNQIGSIAQDQLNTLTQKKEQWDKSQQQKQFQQRSEGQALNRALIDTDAKHNAENGYRAIPDVIAPQYDFDEKGKKYMTNAEEYKASVSMNQKAHEYNHKLDVERVKQEAVKAKEERDAEKEYLNRHKEAAKQIMKIEDEFIKGNGTTVDGKVQNRYRPTSKERGEQVADELEAMGLPRTLEDFKASRNPKANPQLGGSKEVPAKADPVVVADMNSHVSKMPRTESGGVSLDGSSLEQLDQLAGYYRKFKAIGMSEADAAKQLQKIEDAKAKKTVAAEVQQRQPEAVSASKNRLGRGADAIAAEAPYVGNRLAAGAKTIGGDVYDDVLAPIGAGAERAGNLVGINRETVGAAAGEVAKATKKHADREESATKAIIDRIEQGGANTYNSFKRWLGK